jgi:hypothetical protein
LWPLDELDEAIDDKKAEENGFINDPRYLTGNTGEYVQVMRDKVRAVDYKFRPPSEINDPLRPALMKLVPQRGRQEMQVYFPGDEGVFWDCTIFAKAENPDGSELNQRRRLWALLGNQPIFVEDGEKLYRTRNGTFYTSKKVEHVDGKQILIATYALVRPPDVFMYPAGLAISALPTP